MFAGIGARLEVGRPSGSFWWPSFPPFPTFKNSRNYAWYYHVLTQCPLHIHVM
uniref:Uncharacterized protein n=1 Tax=Anguilla anguilla TaxID=7936 RepID=A0A0E9RJX3_ANGAN